MGRRLPTKIADLSYKHLKNLQKSALEYTENSQNLTGCRSFKYWVVELQNKNFIFYFGVFLNRWRASVTPRHT